MFKKIFKFASNYKKNIFALFFLFFSIILGLSLISFNSTDQSWFYFNASKAASKLVCKNWLGVAGSNISSLFFYFFGIAAYLFVLFFIYFSYLLFFNISFKKEIERFFSFLFMPFILAAILSFYKFNFLKSFFNAGFNSGLNSASGKVFSGGVIGNGLKIICVGWFDNFGAIIFLYSLFLVSFFLVFRKFSLWFLSSFWKFICFLCNKQKFLIPAYKVSKKIAYILVTPFIFAFKFCKKLFTGQDFVGENRSVTEFENYNIDEHEKKNLQDLYSMLSKSQGNNQDNNLDLDLKKEGAYGTCTKTSCDFDKIGQASQISQEGQVNAAVLEGQAGQVIERDRKYNLPDSALFDYKDTKKEDDIRIEELKASAKVLEEKLEMFGIFGKVVSIKRGPVITLFEYNPKADSKISKIVSMADDLALALKALSIRIIAPIPGKSVVGFEVSNAKREEVLLSSIINSKEFESDALSVPIVLGKDTVGNNVIVDLVKMPHLLIAGSTGSGKSVALNSLLVSMLCKLTPDELNLILIDPKRLEFSAYEDIAHLLFPIVTEPKKVVPILKWVISQMEERYAKMAKIGAKNIFDYNNKISGNKVNEKMPFLVIIVDELADLMMTVGRDLEGSITRIAQMARAAGIHMIVATQRPSVDVITGIIKVNFPSRISFRVTSKVDSRTILDCCGAEKLLGRGDMLFLGSGSTYLTRLHGAYVSNDEIEKVVNHIKQERKVVYKDISEYLSREDDQSSDLDDVLYEDILVFLNSTDEVSISLLQRKFRIGYNRSARIIEKLEIDGIILPSDGGKTRKVVR